MDPLLVTIVGIAIVFGVLILLVLIISFFNVISSKIDKINAKTKKVKKDEKVVVEENSVVDIKDNKKTVAIITAALMASVYSGTNTRFIVKKIKKI